MVGGFNPVEILVNQPIISSYQGKLKKFKTTKQLTINGHHFPSCFNARANRTRTAPQPSFASALCAHRGPRGPRLTSTATALSLHLRRLRRVPRAVDAETEALGQKTSRRMRTCMVHVWSTYTFYRFIGLYVLCVCVWCACILSTHLI